MNGYFAKSLMDLNSTNNHIGIPRLDLKKTLSHNDLSPRTHYTTGSKSDILSPRYFEDTPGPNSYRLKTTIGSTPGVSFKGDRKRNFDSAKKEACFLLPNLVDDTPGPNAYKIEEKFGFGSNRTSLKGRRSGPFQSNRGQMHTTPQFDERGSRFLSPVSYEISSLIGKSRGVSMKGDRTRNFNETPRLNCGFLLPKNIPKTPGPGSYNIGSTVEIKSTSPSFKGSRSSLGPFQTESGRTYIAPELASMTGSDKMYDIPTAVGRTPGVSMKGNRQRKFDTAKNQNAVFLVPDMIDETPAPGAYEIKTTVGTDSIKVLLKGSRSESRAHAKQKSRQRAFVEMNTPGISFKGDRTRRFDHLKENQATFLLPEESNEAPAPGSYNIRTTIGSDINGLKERRVRDHYGGPFQSNSGPMYIKPEINTKDKTPGPNNYKINTTTMLSSPAVSFKGRRLKSLFGEPARPGPADYTPTKANLRKTPMFPNRQKPKTSYPESLNYTNKGRLSPGSAHYFPQDQTGTLKFPVQLRSPQNSKDSSFSFHTPNLVEEGPSHGAYTLLNKQRTNIATTLKGRTSPYVYSGFQTNKFTEDVGSNVVVAQG